MSIRRFYNQWPIYNERLVEVLGAMTPEQLAIRPAPDVWPIWATVGHIAGTRVFWIYGVCREPGADTTPFVDPLSGVGWEDDEDTPRSAAELVGALETTWALIDSCLDRWTPSMLDETVINTFGGGNRPHTRASIVQRMMTHEAYHCGELSQTLGLHGLTQIDPWR